MRTATTSEARSGAAAGTNPAPAALPAGPSARSIGSSARMRWSGRIVGLAFGLLLLVLGVARIAAPGSPFAVAPGTSSRWVPAAVAVLVLGALTLLASIDLLAGSRRTGAPRLRRLHWAAFFALALAAQLLLAHAVLQNPPYDAAQIFTAAYTNTVASTPRLFPHAAQADYFAMYPNNALLVDGFSMLFGVLHALGLRGAVAFLFAAASVNCIALTASFAGACWVAGRIAGQRAAIAAAALGIPLLGVSPWIAVPYSDTLSMPFPVAAVLIGLVWPVGLSIRTTGARWALLGTLAAVGFAVKPTTLFAVAAVMLIDLWRLRQQRSFRVAAVAVVAAAGAFGASHAAIALVPSPAVSAVGTVPFTHFMAMGASIDGSFHQQDLDATMGLAPDARSSARLEVWEHRVGDMGPAGYAGFLAAKVLAAASDGSFYQGHEGVGPYSTAFFSSDALSSRLQSVFPLTAPLHPALATLWQAAWWVVLTLCLVPGRRGLSALAVAGRPVLRLSVLLLLAFLCISESRSRYLYHYMPLLLVLAGTGSVVLGRHASALRARLGRRRGRPRPAD